MMSYDNENIFSKILKGEIPCDKVYEDENILCFKDINPIAKIQVLIIPKDKYISFNDLVETIPDKKRLRLSDNMLETNNIKLWDDNWRYNNFNLIL